MLALKGTTIGTRELRFVFLVFLFSRLVIFAAMAVSPRFIAPVTGPGVWNLDTPLLRPLFRWDTGWYMSISKTGYSYNGNPRQRQNIAFFPLYPLTCRLCHAVTGLSIPFCAVFLSNIAFFVGLVALYALVSWEIGPDVARSAILLLAFFPASFFFSTMYAESFSLVFSVLAYASFRRQKFVKGGIWAGLASATRVTGILLIVPLLFEGFPYLRDRRARRVVFLAALLTLSGIGAFSFYQLIVFGDPLAYFKVQHQWRGGFALPFKSITEGLVVSFRAQFSPLPLDLWLGFMFVSLAVTLPSYLPRSYSVYTLLGVAMPLLTEAGVVSLARCVSVLFPGFMALGILGRKSKWIPWVLLAVFTLGLIHLSMHFAQWHWVT